MLTSAHLFASPGKIGFTVLSASVSRFGAGSLLQIKSAQSKKRVFGYQVEYSVRVQQQQMGKKKVLFLVKGKT